MFLETPRFPDNIFAYGSSGGPRYSTSIAVVRSGREKANANWQNPLHSYDAATGVRSEQDFYEVLEFFHAAGGMANGFRVKDPRDFKSVEPFNNISAVDQIIGTGDSSEKEFQLVKNYTTGAAVRARTIKKPVSGTVLIALNGTPQSSGWSVDTTTGLVLFIVAPGSGVTVTAGYEMDTPCRFGVDDLPLTWEDFQLESSTISIVEKRI